MKDRIHGCSTKTRVNQVTADFDRAFAAGGRLVAAGPLELLAPPGIDPVAFKWLSLIQPAILAVLAVVMGHSLAHRNGLDAPALRALVTRQPVAPVLVGQIKPGILVGLAAGLVLAAYKTFTEGQIASA